MGQAAERIRHQVYPHNPMQLSRSSSLEAKDSERIGPTNNGASRTRSHEQTTCVPSRH
jgi:hypothetical protein